MGIDKTQVLPVEGWVFLDRFIFNLRQVYPGCDTTVRFSVSNLLIKVSVFRDKKIHSISVVIDIRFVTQRDIWSSKLQDIIVGMGEQINWNSDSGDG